ncbi:MAG: hypothetical protein HC836_05095 [Richelia sp. RM2_1_2]|nr:hypothetical protein [Richelia sp. SM1_7_0]NJN09917.1 hypothetical protein [Richelia sp. RM1_1_1]NJO26587.1 hypothetical protein [Richelia sp. SL_2_1]NJO57755.1 hypothetical protein [Richelia sp. RM2_1_2]
MIYIRGVRLTSSLVKRLFCAAIFGLSMSLTVACQQGKDSQDSTVESVNPTNNQNIATTTQKTPGEISVNVPSPFPTVSSPQVTAPAIPNSVARVPQNQNQAPGSESSSENNSISKALTEKLGPQAASQPNISQPQTQTEIPNQPNSNKPVVQALRSAANNPGRKIAAASNTNVYRSQRLGVNFNYPKGFVIKEPQSGSNASKVLELWSLQDYQAIAEGKYQNTFSPGNMSISLENNPQGLSLVQWVSNNEEFGDVIPESYDTKIVAGKEAISFRTEGLYEFQNIALPSTDGKKIILISFAKGDKNYQNVFDQVVSSLQVN